MKLLDKYVARNFLTGYGIAFAVLMGLRILIDLFVNIDEFAEHADLGALAVTYNILSYYTVQSTLYFRDFAGMITVVAAVFSLGKLVRSNELIAVMASGVSLKRIIVPIVVLAIVFTCVFVIDQEFIIPPLAPELVRSHDALPGQETYDVDFISDSNGALVCAQQFDVKDFTLHYPTIFTRLRIPNTLKWTVIGQITAKEAVYNYEKQRWDLRDGLYAEKAHARAPKPQEYFETDLRPEDIPIRQRAGFKTLLSWRQLSILASAGTKVKDVAQLYSQKHFRITDPIINLIMLLVALPILVCRDPRTMKSAIMISFATTTACYITTFACKMMATEVVFERIVPEFWAWLPIVIFFPVAFVELDSMKT
ncbi:MAG: LptF/LptG family permease [Sedimentisphaerales bacterium]|nr:LptF/LptG family permease [Sedimentisphaerales bacterium]